MEKRKSNPLRKALRMSVPLILLTGLLFSSCIPQSRLTYLQDKHAVIGDHLDVDEKKYQVKPGDVLYVRVMTTDPEIHEVFNLREGRTYRARTDDVGDPHMYLYGYTVNEEGYIDLPVIGKVKVAGHTISEIHDIVKDRSEEYLVDASISVRLVNFKVTVLGEVNRPGTYNIYDEEFTVMDAIGTAGDMTDYGNRKVHIVRKTDDGRQFEKLDLTDRESAASDMYYLQPNDLVYVEPMLAKRFALAQFPYAELFSAISTIILLLNYVN